MPLLQVGASVKSIYENLRYQLLVIAAAATSTLMMMYLRPDLRRRAGSRCRSAPQGFSRRPYSGTEYFRERSVR